VCEVLIGQRLRLHQGQGCVRYSLFLGFKGGTVCLDVRSDLLVGGIFQGREGSFQLLCVDLIILTGEATDEGEGGEALVLSQVSPLNEAVNGIESLVSAELSASVFVNMLKGLSFSWLFSGPFSAVGRREREILLAFFLTLFVLFF